MTVSTRSPAAPPVPHIVRQGVALRNLMRTWHREDKTIGLVPTMGALHEGHLSLVDRSVAECDVTVVTVFVNPAQFDDEVDLQRYPRDLDRDVAILAQRGCDLVFAPDVQEMYPPDYETYVEVGPTANTLEGACRAGHFRGVATIVLKLFQLAPADRAYFGQKDYQQTLIIKRMAKDFNLPVEIRVCDTVRESDGLALSSRNAHLKADERRRACALYQSLELAAQLVRKGEQDAATILRQMREHLDAQAGIEVEYVELVADGSVQPVSRVEGPTYALIAARVGKTRLIDNQRIC